jgi:hypothetical protein
VLFLYTDGLIEEPGVPLNRSLEKLRTVVEQAAGDRTDPSWMCDMVRRNMLASRKQRDDLCIVVLATNP